jgi:hypothetical protein
MMNASAPATSQRGKQPATQLEVHDQQQPELPPPRTRRTPGWLPSPIVWVSVASFLLAAIFARVPLSHLNQGAVGGDIDGYNNIWNYYWLKTALLDLHRNPYFTDYIYYPTGISLRFHTFNPINGLITMPFNLAFGYIPTFNLLFFFAPALTLLFSFLLIRDWVGNPWATFAGAVIAAYGDYHIAVFLSAGQSSYITLQWIPLYFFFLFRAVRGAPLWTATNEPSGFDTRKWLLYTALSILTLLLITLTDWQFLMLVVFATLLYGAFILFTSRPWRDKAVVLARLAAIGGIYAAIVAFPLLLPMIKEAADNPWLDVSYQSPFHSVDILWLVTPGIGLHGLVVLTLTFVGLWKLLKGGTIARQAALFWLLVVAFFYLMSLGAVLVVNGKFTDIPLLYSLLQKLPVISSGRDPARFTLIATIGMSILFAFGVRALLTWLRAASDRQDSGGPSTAFRILPSAFWPAVAVALLLAAPVGSVLAESGRVHIDPPRFPDFYNQLAQDKDSYAILELPIFSDAGLGADHYQMYQLLHQKFRFSGRLARDRKLTNPDNFVKTSSLFDHLWLLSTPTDYRDRFYPKEDFLQRTDYSTQGLAILNYYKVRYIILYKEALAATGPDWDEQDFQKIIGQVLGPGAKEYYDDQVMRVYKVPDGPPAANPLTLDTGEGWYKSEKRSTDGVVYRWANLADSDAAQLYSMNLWQQPVSARLIFTVFPYQTPRTLHVTLDGAPAATFQLKPENGEQPFSVDLTMTSGNHLIAFTSPEPPQPANLLHDTRQLSFSLYNVQLQRIASSP